MTSQVNTLTIHLMGGLGNQLFQYAFGRRLALANQAELLLDLSGYPAGTEVDAAKGQRACELTKFNVVGCVIPNGQGGQGRFSASRVWRKGWLAVGDLLDRFRPFYDRRVIIEPASDRFCFDRRIYERDFRGAIEARGFWQTEQYFAEIDGILRQELTLRENLDRKNQEMASRIASSNSVGIHIRHGDNANLVASALGVLPREYYIQALAALKANVKRPSFFIFSDDINWARDFLSGIVPDPIMVHNGSMGAAEDLWLMSSCKYHVLANSTFGWWGAWIGRKPDQIVYAPRRYYQKLELPNPDFYPASWRLL